MGINQLEKIKAFQESSSAQKANWKSHNKLFLIGVERKQPQNNKSQNQINKKPSHQRPLFVLRVLLAMPFRRWKCVFFEEKYIIIYVRNSKKSAFSDYLNVNWRRPHENIWHWAKKFEFLLELLSAVSQNYILHVQRAFASKYFFFDKEIFFIKLGSWARKT